jgi:hypothetical protein
MPEDAQVVRQYIIDKLKAEGEKRTSPRRDPKVIMARIVQRYRASQSAA